MAGDITRSARDTPYLQLSEEGDPIANGFRGRGIPFNFREIVESKHRRSM